VSEKVVNGFIGCELMNELKDGWLRERVDGVFWEDERLVVITEEEYDYLLKVKEAAYKIDAQIARAFGLDANGR
jgi:hypothetical protein